MKKTEIILIRHGETEWNKQRRMQGHLNSNLSKLGESQINSLGKWIQKIPFDYIYSSDSVRARKTAEAITKLSGDEIRFDKRIREKNLGVFEGLTSEEAMDLYPEVYNKFKTAGSEYVLKNGESTKQLLNRAYKFLEEIRANHKNKRVIVVTHGGVIRVLAKCILGISLDSPTSFKIMNTGLFHICWEEKWIISQMGVISHLSKVF